MDGLWGVDHMVMPHHTDSLYTLGRKPAEIADDAVSGLLSPNYEMMTTLCWVAGFTEPDQARHRGRRAPDPQRGRQRRASWPPSTSTRAGGCSTASASGGSARKPRRWACRGTAAGRRSEEHIALLRALWCADGDLVEFHGEFHDLPPMDPEPRPVQRPIPILIGGHSDIALERAGRIGDGWIAASMSPEPLAEHWAKVRAAAERNGRDPDALLLVAAMRPVRGEQQADAIAAYAALGVDHLIVDLYVQSRDAVFDELHRFASDVAPQFRAALTHPGLREAVPLPRAHRHERRGELGGDGRCAPSGRRTPRRSVSRPRPGLRRGSRP